MSAQAAGEKPAKTKPRHAATTAPTKDPAYGARADVMAFADEVATNHSLPRAWVRKQLAQARKVESVRKLIMPPPVGTPKNWAAYRERFVEPRRIEAGLRFWRENERWLTLAEQRWGVPPEVVVAIVGVETFYGRVMGNFRVIDALATLSFDFPPNRKDRTEFFRGELLAYLLMCRYEGSDPQTLRGSYAGAMGLPQFMPGSVNRYAIDMDGDGHINLHSNPADVVGSVAHYLAEFGWQRGMPTHYAVSEPAEDDARAVLLAPDIVPSFSAAQFAGQGAVLNEGGRSHVGPLALVELQNGQKPSTYVAGTQNFYVVTRYNWSSYYAMAVIDLAQSLATARTAAR